MQGAWFDGISALWREISTGIFTANDGSQQNGLWTRNGGSLLFRGALKPGAKIVYPIAITWYFPNSNLIANVHKIHGAKNEADYEARRPTWQPYYAGVWKDAADVAGYVKKNYTSLRSRTLAFKDALFSSTVPREVIDAVSSNLAILKSPTVLRQKTGISGDGRVSLRLQVVAVERALTSGIMHRRCRIFSPSLSVDSASRN